MASAMGKHESADEKLLPGGTFTESDDGGETWILAGVLAGLLITLVLFVVMFGTPFSRSNWPA